METMLIFATDYLSIETAVKLLCEGQVVAFPTDTVYGIGSLVTSTPGIESLYRIKERIVEKAIPVLLSSPNELEEVSLAISDMAYTLAQRYWPGPLTLVVPKRPDLPQALSSRPTIGVRMPDHPVALALLKRAGPLAVTSANISGAENSPTAQQVLAQLGGRIPLILDGGLTPGGQPSTVVDCTGSEPRVLRVGPITLKMILDTLK